MPCFLFVRVRSDALFSVFRVRSDALLQLSWFLSNEANSDKKIPVFADLDLTTLANVFIIETPRVVDDDFSRSVFKVREILYIKKTKTLVFVIERERNVLFNDALNTFYLRVYGIRHMVKDHSDSEKGNPLPPHRLLLSINSKGSFICTIPQTG